MDNGLAVPDAVSPCLSTRQRALKKFYNVRVRQSPFYSNTYGSGILPGVAGNGVLSCSPVVSIWAPEGGVFKDISQLEVCNAKPLQLPSAERPKRLAISSRFSENDHIRGQNDQEST